MFFILSKIFNFLLTPLSWILILLLLSWLIKSRAKAFRICALVVFVFFSSPIALRIVNSIWQHPITLDENLTETKVGVVLGGYAAYDTTSSRITFGFGGDRLNQSLRLLGMRTFDRLILSGGSGFVNRPDLKEALYVADFLDEVGIPKRKVWIESESRNTYENAIETRALLEDKGQLGEPIMLITSGFHMPRAVACFEKQGIQVIPYSTDSILVVGIGFEDFIPNAHVLSYWNVLIHEWLGYVSYWVMGYI